MATEEIDNNRLGRYVTTTYGSETVRAFVPPPLPPDPPLRLDPMQRLLEEAVQALGRLDGLATLACSLTLASEAQAGGPIAAVQEGDIIEMEIDSRTINVELSQEEMNKRLREWTPRPPRYKSGVFQKYVKCVGSASKGAVMG